MAPAMNHSPMMGAKASTHTRALFTGLPTSGGGGQVLPQRSVFLPRLRGKAMCPHGTTIAEAACANQLGHLLLADATFAHPLFLVEPLMCTALNNGHRFTPRFDRLHDAVSPLLTTTFVAV